MSHCGDYSWRCGHDETKFCPPEGCPKSYGCARDKGWKPGMPTPNGCIGLPDTVMYESDLLAAQQERR